MLLAQVKAVIIVVKFDYDLYTTEPSHTHTHKYAHTHTYAHTQIHTHTHKYTHTHTCTHTNTHTHTYAHTHRYTHTRTHTRTHTHTWYSEVHHTSVGLLRLTPNNYLSTSKLLLSMNKMLLSIIISRLVIREKNKARSHWESNPGRWLEPPVL